MVAFSVQSVYVLQNFKGRSVCLPMVPHKAYFNIPFRHTVRIFVVVLELKKLWYIHVYMHVCVCPCVCMNMYAMQTLERLKI